MIWQIAARNLFRNTRRSLMTVFAIGVSGLAMLLFGGFVTSIWFGFQTSLIQEQGNIQIFKTGYLAYGAADPDAYTLDDAKSLIDAIEANPALASRITTITPQIAFGGIAGNTADQNSKTFIGKGIVASDANKMRTWDGFGLGISQAPIPLSDTDPEGAVVGVGMARMIGLCDELALADCKDPPKHQAATTGEKTDFSDLVGDALTQTTDKSGRPRLDLLAATSSGAPNIVSVFVNAAQTQATRAVDNAMVMLNYENARKLLYGSEQKATLVLLQAKNPEDSPALKADIASFLASKGFDTEVFLFNEVDPTFNRVFAMFSFIFGVVSLVLAVVIVFTIINTVTMNVMERITEVGTIRALGFRRRDVFRQFLTESLLLGVIGAAFALLLAIIVSNLLNSAGLQWTPPSNASPMTIDLMVTDNPVLMFATIGFLAFVTVLASVLPALRAVRFPIVSALHHA